MAKPKKWNEMSPAEQAAENEAREAAKAARRAAERAELEAEAAGPGNKGKLADKKKASSKPQSAGSKAAPTKPEIKPFDRRVNPKWSPDGALSNADTKVLSQTDIPKPADSSSFDFEKAKPKLNLVTNDAPTEVPTQTYEQPKPQKGKLAKAAKAAKAPAAASTAAPQLPNRPFKGELPGQGSMEGKPVEHVTVKVDPSIVPEDGHAKWNAAKDAERRVTQGSAPQAERRAALEAQQVMTPAGKVEPTVPKPAAPAKPPGIPKMSMDDLIQPVSHARGPMTAEDIGLQVGKLSARQRAARAAGGAVATGAKWAASKGGRAALGVAKGITEPIWKPIAQFAEGHAERKAAAVAADAASKSAKTLGERVAARAGQAAVSARTAGAVGMMGARFGIGAAKLGLEGLAIYGLEQIGEQGALAQTGSQATMNRHVRSGKKQGLEVTHAEPSIWRMALGGSPKIKVHDPSQDVDASGKSLAQRRRERGEAKFAENEYNRVKKAAGRNVIVGSSRPKGGSEQV